MEIPSIFLFFVAALALNLTPGPDMLFVISRSLAQGRGAGIASSFGIAAGCVVHTLLVAFGIATVLSAVPMLYDALRIAGAAYLVVLGIKMCMQNPLVEQEAGKKALSVGRLFGQGFLTNLLNPKVALFFLAFLPQFVSKSESVAVQIVLLGLLFNLSGSVVNIAVAMGAASVRRRLRPNGLSRWIPGGVMIGLGVHLMLKRD